MRFVRVDAHGDLVWLDSIADYRMVVTMRLTFMGVLLQQVTLTRQVAPPRSEKIPWKDIPNSFPEV